MTEWIEVLRVLVDGPSLPIQGIVRSVKDKRDDKSESFMFLGDAPMFVGLELHETRVWRHGGKVRVQEQTGTPTFISDSETAWQFDGEAPVYGDTNRVRFHGPGAELLITRDARDWLHGDDFTQPTGPVRETTYLGRNCWKSNWLRRRTKNTRYSW
jgi:hypothetical protein